MTMRAVYSYSNPDATTDMNAHFRVLFGKGIVSGGLLTPIGGTYQITIAPFAAMSADGMVIESDTATTVTVVAGKKQYIVLLAQYNAPAAPTMQIQVLDATTYATSPYVNYLVVLGTVYPSASSASVISSDISYSEKDTVSKGGRDSFKGSFATEANLRAAYTQGATNRDGDYAMIYGTTPPSIYVWKPTGANSYDWIKFTDYSQLEADFEQHATDQGTDTTLQGDKTKARHITQEIKEALAGTSTGTTPSASNKFVTEKDSTRILSEGERAALTGAVGGTLSATNPLIGQNMLVVEERVYGFTAASGGQPSVTLSTTIDGQTYNIFVGKRGLENNVIGDQVSSARRYFRVEDESGQGLRVGSQAYYVDDILYGGNSFNPSATTTVEENGFWTGSGNIAVHFNAPIPAGTTFYIRLNVNGNVKSLSPASRSLSAGDIYPIPPTGYKSQAESYFETLILHANSIVTENIQAHGIVSLADGTAAEPSLSFSSNSKNGLFYTDHIINGTLSSYDAVSVALNGHAYLTMSRASQSVDVSASHLLEADVDDDGFELSKWSMQGSGSYPKTRWMFGTSGYNNQFTAFFGIDARRSLFPFMSIQSNLVVEGASTNQIIALPGTELNPSIGFNVNPSAANSASKTGFYYAASSILTGNVTSLYNGIGVTILGNTALRIGHNASSSSTSSQYAYGSALIEKTTDGVVRFGTWGADGSSFVPLSLGYASYNLDWVELINLSSSGIQINGQSQPIRITATNTQFDSDVIITGNLTFSGSLVSPNTITGAKFSATDSGNASSPAYKMTLGGAFYGMFAGTSNDIGSLSMGSYLGLSVRGRTALALGVDGTSSDVEPLMINGFGYTSRRGYNISVPDYARIGSNLTPHDIRFGMSRYNTDFDPMLSISTDSIVSGTAGVDAYVCLSALNGFRVYKYSSADYVSLSCPADNLLKVNGSLDTKMLSVTNTSGISVKMEAGGTTANPQVFLKANDTSSSIAFYGRFSQQGLIVQDPTSTTSRVSLALANGDHPVSFAGTSGTLIRDWGGTPGAGELASKLDLNAIAGLASGVGSSSPWSAVSDADKAKVAYAAITAILQYLSPRVNNDGSLYNGNGPGLHSLFQHYYT